MFDLAQHLVEEPTAIAAPVVGEDLLDLHALLGEPVPRPLPKARRGLFALVSENLRIRQPAVVIDG